jgi:hypothetical protein
MAIANNDVGIGIGLAATSGGGLPDIGQDSANVLVYETDAGAAQAEYTVSEGGATSHTFVTTDVDLQGQALCYAAIHKIGSVLHGWAGTADGHWIYMGNETYTGAALDRVYIYGNCNSGLSPGNPMLGVNFIRFVETATFLP